MIISASRRTDIPAFYTDWLINRINEGTAETRNPLNPGQVRTLSLSPENIDCIVFWTKNPAPMLARLDELRGYEFYFQYTLNSYGTEIETGLPPLGKRLDTFKRLSDITRNLNDRQFTRVIWRYDPIFINDGFSVEFHQEAFKKTAEALKGYTDRCVISFIDYYPKARKSFIKYDMRTVNDNDKSILAESFSGSFNGEIFTCAEETDLSRYGIGHSACVDARFIERLTGKTLKKAKDRNQRAECGCASATDIGAYNTCIHGCRYCYANYSVDSAKRRYGRHDPKSASLLSF